jgi:hypothetical protein
MTWQVLSDETSASHQPDARYLSHYTQMYDTVCAASLRAAAPSDTFLDGLSAVIAKLGGPSKTCDEGVASPAHAIL